MARSSACRSPVRGVRAGRAGEARGTAPELRRGSRRRGARAWPERGRVVADLEPLLSAHPLRERLRGQLMLALYRSGRQAEALAAYQDARRVLVEELGIEPGRELQDLERAILRQDASLDLPAAAETADRTLVGRERELGVLRQALDARSPGAAASSCSAARRASARAGSRTSSHSGRASWARRPSSAAPGKPAAHRPTGRGRRRSGRMCAARTRRPCASSSAAARPTSRRCSRSSASSSRMWAHPCRSIPRAPAFDSSTRPRASSATPQRPNRSCFVLDDLHAADPSSLLLLDFVARELAETASLVLGCYRGRNPPGRLSRHAARALAGRTGRGRRAPGLGESDVAEYLERLTRARAGRGTVARSGRTDGNPSSSASSCACLRLRAASTSTGASAYHPGSAR